MTSTRVRGRPSHYKPTYVAQVRKLCLLGLTDDDIAGFFDCDRHTVRHWQDAHPAFATAMRQGKAVADANVVAKLYERALGYAHADVETHVVNGAIVQTKVTRYYPPDYNAMAFWLRNRQPDRWTMKVDVTHQRIVDPVDMTIAQICAELAREQANPSDEET